MMFFKNYEYFLAIVEKGGLTRAAESLYISQPSLSKYLSRLEENLGVELFDHGSYPLALTYAGERYYDFVKRMQTLERRLKEEFNDIRSFEAGEIRLGIPPWRGAIMLPNLLPTFHEFFPMVEVSITEGRATFVESELVKGNLDLCMMNLPQHFPNQTKQEILWNEKILLVGNRNHPVVREALETSERGPDGYRSIDAAFLENEDFITFKPGQNIYVASQHIFSIYNIQPKHQWSTENMTTALNMVSRTLSFTIMPEGGVWSSFLPENVEYFSILHAQEIFSFAAVFQKDYIPNKWVRTLLEIARNMHADSAANS